jgi:Rad3-related DNA helicase
MNAMILRFLLFLVSMVLLNSFIPLQNFFAGRGGVAVSQLKAMGNSRRPTYTSRSNYNPRHRSEKYYEEQIDKLMDNPPKPKTSRRPTARKISEKKSEVENDSQENRPHFYSQKSFRDIGLNSQMVNILSSLGYQKPSKIQALSFRPIYFGQNCVIGDQTGSGKTLGYLLPVLQRMTELLANRTVLKAPERAPFVVIMTPTTELAE